MRNDREWHKHEQRQDAEIRMLRRELEAARVHIDELLAELELAEAQAAASAVAAVA